MNALIVGLGSIGRRHLMNLRAVCPKAGLTVLRRPTSAAAPSGDAAEEFHAEIVHSLNEALERQPAFAVIASPAACHLETALPLAERGIHLLIEKPLAHSTAGVDELISVCERNRIVALVGYQLRFEESLRTLRDAVRDKRIGRVLGFHAEVGQYLPDWRPGSDYRRTASASRELGGGALLELSHELDYTRWIFGEPATVFAQVAPLGDLGLDVDDYADLTLSFRNGVFGHIHLNMVQRAPSRTCRVIGAEGTLIWDALSGRVQCYSAASGAWSDLCPEKPRDRNAAYIAQIRHFLDCIAGRATAAVTLRDGRQVLRIIEAARASSDAGRVLEIPE